MDNLLSSDDETLYLNSDFDVFAHNFAVFKKPKISRTGQTDIIFKPELQPETTEWGYNSKIRLLIHWNILKINHKKHLLRENGCKTKSAGCSVITSEKSDAIIKPVDKKRLMKYYPYERN
jgi:hypothetical protein